MTGQVATTNGWDTVYGVPISNVNKVIVSSKSSPADFTQQDSDPLGGDYTIEGDFSDWQIVKGGAGTLLHMNTPVTRMTLKSAASQTPEAFTNGTIVVEVNLQYLPSPKPTPSGRLHDLKLKSAVRIISSSFSESNYGTYRELVQSAILKWYNANITAFQHTFVTVNLNRAADKGQFKWLLPTACSYSYVDIESEDAGVLGILCMTEGRSAPADQQLSPNVIPPGSSAGFLINEARFMQDLLLPAMPQSFKGTTASDYTISPDYKTITLNNTDVALQLPQKSDYTPYLESLSLSIDSATQLQIDTRTKANILDQLCGMGQANSALYPDQHSSSGSVAIWSWCHTNSKFEIELCTLSNGNKSLNFNQVGTPVKDHWTTQSEGMAILKDILEAVAVLVTIVLGVLTDGAGFIIGAMIIGILTSLVTTALPQLIATLGTDDAPTVDLLVLNATDPIQWPSGTHFNINKAALNGCLQLGGNPS